MPALSPDLSKAEHIFATDGAPALAAFANGLGIASGPDAPLAIAKFLDSKNCSKESLEILTNICRTFNDRLDIYETIGKRAKSGMPKIGPTPAPVPRISTDACEYVTVLGSSYVRSFASGTRFLPLMLGPGKSLCFLTEDAAAVSRRVTLNVLARTDPRSLILLVFGNGDAQNHARNDYGTWAAVENGALPSHDHVMRAAMARYFDMVKEIRALNRFNIVMFCAAPMLTVEINRGVAVINEEIHAFGRAHGIPVLDLTEELTDPATGNLKAELCSAPDNPHMSHEVVPLVEQGLQKLGVLPAEGQTFSWEYMFRFAIDPQIETRIWCEPHMGAGNILHSHKIMFSQIVERVGNILVGHLAGGPPGKVLVLNGREGFLAAEVPPGFATQITSIDAQESKALVGRRIRAILGRHDIDFVTLADPATFDASGYDYAVMVIHENDDSDACLETLSVIAPQIRRRTLVMTALNIGARFAVLPGIADVNMLNLSNRLITGYWSGARLYALTPLA